MVKDHPIFILGQNADKAGQGSCCLHGLVTFVPFLNWFCIAKNRQMVREQNDIDGGFVGDCCTVGCCCCCAVVQAKSVGVIKYRLKV